MKERALESQSIPLIVIAGPTGVGKTDLSIKLAQEYDGEIINGDSMQVYRGLDIGTGKISPAEMAGIPHHLLDICELEEDFDAHRFQALANSKIHEIHARGKLPILVGGTGLYIEGLLYDLEFGYTEGEDSQIRQALTAATESQGAYALWQQLEQLDPEAAAKIPYQNVRRTIRALEVIQTSGRKFSEQKAHQQQLSKFQEKLIILNRQRSNLYDRINRRVEAMLAAGLEAEARQLYDAAEGQAWQSTRGIGYKEWWPYFQGEISLEEVLANIQQNSRRYAKRQLTWFRNRMKEPIWLDLDEEAEAYARLQALMAVNWKGRN